MYPEPLMLKPSTTSSADIAASDHDQYHDLLTPKTYIEKQDKLRSSANYKQIQSSLHKEIDILISNESKYDLKLQCQNKNCPGKHKKDIFDKCESVKRIRIILKIYKALMKYDNLWKKIPISSLISHHQNIYGFQQLVDDFLHS